MIAFLLLAVAAVATPGIAVPRLTLEPRAWAHDLLPRQNVTMCPTGYQLCGEGGTCAPLDGVCCDDGTVRLPRRR
jgi:hypothetical protein